jgi:ubiquinone/menaquinone biosynthesis C-methylase UbiE
MKRVPTHELLDTDSGTPEEISASLVDLLNINSRFGGVSTGVAMIERIATKLNTSHLSLLEVASGSGDVSRLLVESLRRKGIQVKITLLDRAQSHLGNGFHAVAGDALSLPFQDKSFDLVSCTLFAHHLSPSELVQFAKEGLRVCRRALLVNDVIRDPLHLLLVYAALPLFRSRLTRHDAPASVRQAYTPTEMRTMLQQAKAAQVEVTHHFLYRMAAIAWKDNVDV